MSAAPIRLAPEQNLRLALVDEWRDAWRLWRERGEREAGRMGTTEWRDWCADNPAPALADWWRDHAYNDPEATTMRHPRRTFRCPDHVWRRARRVARRRGDSLSEVLRRALEAYLDAHETAEDRADDERAAS